MSSESNNTKKKESTESPESIIARWTVRDLTALAESGDLSPAYEVEHYVREITDSLRCGRNPLIIGESGVGKSAIVAEIARRAINCDQSGPVAGKRIIQISLARQVAMSKDESDMAKDFQRFIDAIVELRDSYIVFIGDIHIAYEFDLDSLLLSMSYKLEGVIIGEGRPDPVRSMLSVTSELAERYVLMPVEEPSPEVVRSMVQQWRSERLAQGGPRFTDQAIERLMNLAHRFANRNRYPRKVFDLLRSFVVTDNDVSSVICDVGSIIDRFADRYRVPRMLIDPAMPMNLDDLEAQLSRRVLGQDKPVRLVIDMVGRIKSGLTDMKRPFGVFMFTGPTGVGKTFIASLLAERLFGDRNCLIRVNMADCKHSSDAAVLFGDPTERYESRRRGELTNRLQASPFGVLLLDEFDKTNPDLHDRFLQLFDEGEFINGNGETISCRALVIIATANIGADESGSERFGFQPPITERMRQQQIDNALRAKFRIEFINRFDCIVAFRRLTGDDIRRVAINELESLRSRVVLNYPFVTIEFDEPVIDLVSKEGYCEELGARHLKRTIDAKIATALSRTLVKLKPNESARIRVSVCAGEIVSENAVPLAPARYVAPAVSMVPVNAASIHRSRRNGLRVV